MADARDGFPLEAGGGGQQGAGGGEYHSLPAPGPHAGENVPVEDGGGAAAAGGPGVHVLVLPVVQQHAAVEVVAGEVQAVPAEEVQDDGVAQLSQVAGEDQVVVPGGGVGLPEQGGEGLVGRRGRSQGCTMWKMFSVKFNAYSSPEARRF